MGDVRSHTLTKPGLLLKLLVRVLVANLRVPGLPTRLQSNIKKWMKHGCPPSLLVLLLLFAAPHLLRSQPPVVPEWAQPGSATHVQVAPPADFHRPSRNFDTPLGVFEGQSDIGSALVPGSASYDSGTKSYTINSAGYNIWYTRDEFRYLWKKMSGDVSLAADIAYPDPNGYGDRKAVLVIRQNLDDDSKEAITGLLLSTMQKNASRVSRLART